MFVAKLNPTGSTLVYSTYLGGNFSDWGYGIVVDTSGNAFITGVTGSTDFPTTAGAFQTTFGGCVTCSIPGDLFVAKLSADGSSLLYSTYLGGSRNEGRTFDPIIPGMPIAIDSSGNAYVANITQSADFPTTVGAFDTTLGGFGDGFVTKINSDGSALVYSTFLGGSVADRANGIAVDGAGNAYVTGTGSSDFPTTPGAFQTTGGGAFVTKLNPAGSGLVYSTYLGGGEGFGIAVDDAGNAYVTGVTTSTDFPIVNAFQPVHGGGFRDAFVAKLSTSGSTLLYSSFLGGVGQDRGDAIQVDRQGNAYVTGQGCCDFPTVNPLPSVGGFSSQAFVTKIDSNGTPLIFSSLLGGSGEDVGHGIALDAAGNAYVTGATSSTDFPIAGSPVQSTNAGDSDAFVAKIGDAPLAISIDIDIKPGSDPNAIRPTNRGLIPVAILTTENFDALTVSPSTVQFGPNAASMAHRSGHLEDVDGDGDLDLVLHFRTQESGIQCGDTEASLSGETFDGQPIQGSDSIVTVGCT